MYENYLEEDNLNSYVNPDLKKRERERKYLCCQLPPKA